MLDTDPTLSAKDISEAIGISSRKVEANIAKLKERELLERIGSAKGGYWKVMV